MFGSNIWPKPPRPAFRFLGTALLLVALPAHAQDSKTNTATTTAVIDPAGSVPTSEKIEVIVVTPTYGVGIDRNKVPFNVQSATNDDFERTQTLDLTDYMNRSMGSVDLSYAQTNVLQPDVNYRGFTASPLLGLPQGLAVYVNGVRFNEVFGDTVNWDLLPQSMIEGIDLYGGAMPVFGLNTLGGALAVRTKNGFTNEGLGVEVYGGAFERLVANAQAGGNNGTFGYMLNAQYLNEGGWRDRQDSEALNLYGSVGWRGRASTLDLQYMFANTDLTGNGALPIQQLRVDRSSFFTAPDITENNMHMVNLEGRHSFSDDVHLSGNVFFRSNRATSFNGDGTPFEECEFSTGEFLVEEDADFACDGTEVISGLPAEDLDEIITDSNGAFIDGDLEAVNNRSIRDQISFGGNLQTTLQQSIFGFNNTFVVGAAFNHGDVRFSSSVEAAELEDNRVTTQTGIFINDGVTSLDASSTTWSVFFTDTFEILPTVALTLAGRYNDTNITTTNTGELLDENGDGIDDLAGDHDFRRFNPSIGVTWTPMSALNLYVGYAESARAPTPVELACADEDAPCLLPNAFLADPPLEQVVARSVEGGARGRLMGSIRWNVGGFYTVNDADILFLSTGGTTGNQGFFDNVGDTRRMGLELDFRGRLWRLKWFANYSFVHATFEDGFIASSPNHPMSEDLNNDGEDAEILVSAGDRIPGIPQHRFKAGVDYWIIDDLSVGTDVTVNSGVFFRGDEANLLDQTAAFAVVNLRAQYTLFDHITVFGRIENLLNSNYENFGLLGEADEVFPNFDDNRFLGPGAPFGAWIGVRGTL